MKEKRGKNLLGKLYIQMCDTNRLSVCTLKIMNKERTKDFLRRNVLCGIVFSKLSISLVV